MSDAFDGSAEPTIYMSDNRMPVMIEFSSTIIYIVLAVLILALIFILPGIRRTRVASFICLFTLITVGAAIMLGLNGSYWLRASIKIYDASYSSLATDTMTGQLDVNIGLHSTNVTLVGALTTSDGQTKNGVDYNERFHWDKPDQMTQEHIEALRRGLPYPILSVTEFLSHDADGFNWSRQLRQAGYYCSLVLYMSLASWCLQAVVMCLIPIYLPHMMQITGALMMTSVWIYTLIIETPKSFNFQVGGQPVDFAFGFTAITTFTAGAMSMFIGVLMLAIQSNIQSDQFTIMDSEQVVNDRKALYSSNLANNFTLEKKPNQVGISGTLHDNLHQSSNVVISIDDVEEKSNKRSC